MKSVPLETALSRYHDIVDDYDAFLDGAAAPLPLTIWNNRLRTDNLGLRDWFSGSWTELSMRPWHQSAFRVTCPDSLTYVAGYLAGLFHVQEEAALVPVSLLDIHPGHSVLDLCAAPGNKSALIATILCDTGFVIANDISRRRLGIVQGTLDRLGLTNVGLTTFDAAHFPDTYGLYDRILADVPCSCEGTSRKHGAHVPFTPVEERRKLSHLQYRILARAVELCKPGGRIVYATCTYAPEENESVVSQVLSRTPFDLRVVPVTIPTLNYAHGITRWKGEVFRDDVANSMRIWPHQNDTGGFYVAVLERTDKPPEHTDKPEQVTSENLPSRPEEETSIVGYVTEPFGVPTDFIGRLRGYPFSRKYCHVVSKTFPFQYLSTLDSAGARAVNTKSDKPRLSTTGALLFGDYATRNVIDLPEPQFRNYLARRLQDVETANSPLSRVLVRYRNRIFGLALRASDGTLVSLYPRAYAGVEVEKNIASWSF